MSVNGSDTGTPLLGGASPSRARGQYGSISRTFSSGMASAEDDAAAAGAVKGADAVHKNALGTFNGCFIPCCLNIMGVILFLKIGWGIGTAGVMGMLLIFLIAETLCVLTVLSLSAIITNGDMAGGGSYYMISRSLGPEFGGAIGILFYVAYAFGASFYFIGFAEGVALFSFVQPFICESDTDTGCIGNENFNRIVGFTALVICFGTAWGGAEAFTKVNVPLFGVQYLAVLIGLVSYLIPAEKDLGVHNATVPACQIANYSNLGPDRCEFFLANYSYDTPVYGFSSPFNATNNFFSANWPMPSNDPSSSHPWPYPDSKNFAACPATTSGSGQVTTYLPCSFTAVFAVIFPAVTGIMEGANLSGDLKNPAKSIPEGTLWAIVASFVTYMVLIFTMAASFSPDTLRYDGNYWQEATVLGGVPIVVGVVISSLSSGLGALFGGSRIMQAVARDDLFPKALECINVFGYGSPKGDEPHYALILTACIALIGVAIASLDSIAGIITSFFLLTYSIVNWTCFFLSITGAPNFRPTWKYFTWHTALIGSLINLVILFLVNWVFGLISLAAMIMIVLLLQFTGKSKDWGDVSQALVYHQVRKWLLVLDDAESGHTKYWRPSFLVLVDDMQRPYNLLGCLETLKKGGLLVLGGIVVGKLKEQSGTRRNVRRAWLALIKKLNLKAFVQVGVAQDVQSAYQVLASCAGLGGLDTNTVVVPLYLTPMARLARAQSMRNHSLGGYLDEVGSGDEKSTGITMRTKERSASYYVNMADKLANVEPIMSPVPAHHMPSGKHLLDIGANDEYEAKDGDTDASDDDDEEASGGGTASARLPRANAISTSKEWVGILSDTLLLERNIVVEANFAKMQENRKLPYHKRFLRGPENRPNAKFIDAWLNLGFLLGDGDRGFIESIVTAARYNRTQQENAKAEAEKKKKQKGKKAKASTTSVADVDDDLERNDHDDEEEGGVGGGSSDVAAASTETEDSSAEDRFSSEVKRVMLHELDEHLEVGLSFSDSASLLLQLAYILQKSRRWAHQSQLRVNFVYSNTSGEFENDVLAAAIEAKLRSFCDTIRVRVGAFRIINVGASVDGDGKPLDLGFPNNDGADGLASSFAERCEQAQKLVEGYSDRTMLAFLPLPCFDSVDVDDDAACSLYCKALENLTEHLPPAFLVKFGEGKDVVTNAI